MIITKSLVDFVSILGTVTHFLQKFSLKKKKSSLVPLVKKFLFVTDSMLSILQVLIEKVDEYSIIPY